jgi:very-short-patch-repair endonuclease
MATAKPVKDESGKWHILLIPDDNEESGICLMAGPDFDYEDILNNSIKSVTIDGDQAFTIDFEILINEFINDMSTIESMEVVAQIKDILDRCSIKCKKLLSRKFGSPIEKMFWDASRQECNWLLFGLRYQYKVENYTLDFAFIRGDFKLAIEIDGHEFHSTKQQRTRDAKRARKLSELGWEVIRFTGNEVYKDAVDCVLQTCKIIYNRTGIEMYNV